MTPAEPTRTGEPKRRRRRGLRTRPIAAIALDCTSLAVPARGRPIVLINLPTDSGTHGDNDDKENTKVKFSRRAAVRSARAAAPRCCETRVWNRYGNSQPSSSSSSSACASPSNPQETRYRPWNTAAGVLHSLQGGNDGSATPSDLVATRLRVPVYVRVTCRATSSAKCSVYCIDGVLSAMSPSGGICWLRARQPI